MNTAVARNRPQPEQTLLDHTGHFVANAVAATSALQKLGFTVTPFSAQVVPNADGEAHRLTGTGNICVMLEEGYLEFLLHTADTPIGLEFKEALARRGGLHLCAFAVPDAAARHAELVAVGQPMRPLVHFSKDVSTGSGTAVASFTVARRQAGTMAEGRVQVLTHHSVDAMWQPRWTAHKNGAIALRSILISTPEVAATAERYASFLGVPAARAGDCAVLSLSRGRIEIFPEAIAEELIGEAVEPGKSAFVGVRIRVEDLSAFKASEHAELLADGGLRVPFGAALGRGAFLFEAAD